MCICICLVFAFGCRGKPKQVVFDLAERMGVADRWSSREVLLFGTPSAEPHQAEGFYREAPGGGGERFVWSKGESELSLQWPQPQARMAVLEVAPYRGVKDQSVEVQLNGAEVARFALNDTRHRYRLDLPGGAQRSGENRLRFVFAHTASPSEAAGNPDRRQLAAAFYSLTVAPRADTALEDLLRRDAPLPFAVADAGGIPTVVQVGPSALHYALSLPGGAELRFTPELHPAARASAAAALLRVTLQTEQGAERELWRGQVGTSSARKEVAVALPAQRGQVVRLGLHVAAAGSERFAWAVWRAPRVLAAEPGAFDLVRSPAAEPASEPPEVQDLRARLRGTNVVLIVLDAARAANLGCYGYRRPTSPEIDRIAADGVVFDRAYTPAVYTLGAVSSLWTSQYPDRHHAEVSYADRLPSDRLTLAQALGGRGVHTAGFVANAMAGTAFGFERGFSEFVEVFRLFPALGSRAEAFRRVLPAWLSQNRQRPFFAYVHFREPHFPYDPPSPFNTRFGPDAPLDRTQRRDKSWYTDVNQGRIAPTREQVDHLVRLYDGNLAYADQEVGVLRRALEDAGLWDRTVVIITADHGEQLYERGYVSHSAQVYEPSVRVPLIVRFPAGRGPRARRVSGLADLLDLAPTVLDVFAMNEGPAVREFQGRSLLPLLVGVGEGKPAVLSRTVWERPVYALRDERFKLIYDTRTGQAHLFDLQDDPGETRDVADQQPLRVQWLRQSLHHWLSRFSEGSARRAVAGAQAPTREQCENLKSLGYSHAACK